MKITEANLKDIILEELKTIANSKHPSDVEMVEDDTGGGALSDDYEHVPEDVPSNVEKPQARVQRKEPLVRERQYSLRSLLEQDSSQPTKDQLAVNEARFMGGMGFSAGALSESEELDECGCDSLDIPSEHEEARDLDHSDHEGSMVRSQLRRATKYSQKLEHMIRESDDLPEWVDAKIIKASDYLGSVYHYLDYELNGKDNQ